LLNKKKKKSIFRFLKDEPTDEEWEKELNPESEIVKRSALVDPSISRYNPTPETHFQFERLGFFVVDSDSIKVLKKIHFIFYSHTFV